MDLLFPLAAGIAAGALGLVPFLHTNLLLQLTQNWFYGLGLAAFASALAFSHSVFEIIPSVFLFVPSGGQALSMLPAHELAMKGKAVLAARTVLHSMLASFAAALALLPIGLVMLPLLFDAIAPYSPLILIALAASTFFAEKGKNAIAGIFIFLLSGVFGFLLFSFPIQKEPLFPLLSGLFGIPAVLLSFGGKPAKPEDEKGPKGFLADTWLVGAGAVLGMLSDLLPALSPAFVSSIALAFFEESPLAFLQVNSAVISSKMLYDFVAVFSVGKARSGAAVAVQQAVTATDWGQFLIVIAAGAAAFFAALAVLLFASRKLAGAMASLGSRMNAAVLAIIVGAVFAYGGPAGLFTAGVATCIGLLPPLVGARRSHAMGALIVPSIVYSLGWAGPLALLVKTF